MDQRIAEYIESVRETCAKPLAARTRLNLIREAAGRLAAEPVALEESLRFAPEGGYGRNLIHEDPDHGFCVVAMIWPPGAGGLPHDHQTWGVAAVTEGSIRITDFEREDDGSDPERAVVTPRCSIDAGPGAVAIVLPPHDDCHQVSNITGELAISIHTYGKNIVACHAFDPERGSCEMLHPVYTNA